MHILDPYHRCFPSSVNEDCALRGRTRLSRFKDRERYRLERQFPGLEWIFDKLFLVVQRDCPHVDGVNDDTTRALFEFAQMLAEKNRQFLHLCPHMSVSRGLADTLSRRLWRYMAKDRGIFGNDNNGRAPIEIFGAEEGLVTSTLYIG